MVQTCVGHLLRSVMKYASYSDRKAMARDMKPIYTAATVAAAELAMGAFSEAWQAKAPGGGGRCCHGAMPGRNDTAFLAFISDIRKVIYTTKRIESINYQLWKIIKTRARSPR